MDSWGDPIFAFIIQAFRGYMQGMDEIFTEWLHVTPYTKEGIFFSFVLAGVFWIGQYIWDEIWHEIKHVWVERKEEFYLLLRRKKGRE